MTTAPFERSCTRFKLRDPPAHFYLVCDSTTIPTISPPPSRILNRASANFENSALVDQHTGKPAARPGLEQHDVTMWGNYVASSTGKHTCWVNWGCNDWEDVGGEHKTRILSDSILRVSQSPGATPAHHQEPNYQGSYVVTDTDAHEILTTGTGKDLGGGSAGHEKLYVQFKPSLDNCHSKDDPFCSPETYGTNPKASKTKTLRWLYRIRVTQYNGSKACGGDLPGSDEWHLVTSCVPGMHHCGIFNFQETFDIDTSCSESSRRFLIRVKVMREDADQNYMAFKDDFRTVLTAYTE